MGFGASVGALLDTYTKCLALLKAFKRRGERADNGSDQQSLLRRSLKADRAKVRRAYSSRLSESGNRFEKGDGRAKSALSRVLKKLKAAIMNLLRISTRTPNPALDYASLMSLSNASSLKAVKAMDQLSHRLRGSSSHGSVASTSSSSSSSSRHRRHKSSASSSTTNQSSKTKASSTKASEGPSKKHKTKDSNRPTTKAEPARSSKLETNTHSQTPIVDPTTESRHNRITSRSSAVTDRMLTNRMSVLTVSTDSTKLGEIPERKWRTRYDYDAGSDEYNVRPVYPLKPYQPEVKERRFWGLFKRSS